VLDPLPGKRRGRADLGPLRALADVAPGEAAASILASAGKSGARLDELGARLALPAEAVRERLASDAQVVIFGRDPGFAISSAALQQLADAALQRLERFHKEAPLKAAMPREELRRQVFEQAAPGAFEHVLERLAALGRIRAGSDSLALFAHNVTLSSDESQVRAALLEALRSAGLSGALPSEAAALVKKEPRVVERILKLLLQEGGIVRVGEGRLVHAEPLGVLKARVRERWPPGTRLDVAGFKELTGLSRKFVIPLLEYLDRERVTRRSGDDRLVLSPPA
jgi:selenocysteine-specific elongation factor